MPPLAAYIHIPFCTHRCGYCNFTLISGRDDLVEPYLLAMEKELAGGGIRPVQTLFWGGGTPTYLNADALDRLLSLCQRWHPLHAQGEWTVEANPHDVTPRLIEQLKQAAVTRLSIGAQSFAARKLTLLERDHSAAQIEQAVRWGQAAGLSVSLDLIFGTPGETLEEWQADLQQAIALQPQHVSTYGLTWERGTTFWNRWSHGELQRSEEELERLLYATAITTLTAAGWEHYEVSNFARSGQRCRHNEAYWLGHEYYATGPGAARYLDGVRSSDHRSTTTWIKRVLAGSPSPIVECEQLTARERAGELLVFGLRRIEGVRATWFATASGHDLREFIGQRGERLLEQGLLLWHDETLRFSPTGLFVADAICTELLRA